MILIKEKVSLIYTRHILFIPILYILKIYIYIMIKPFIL